VWECGVGWEQRRWVIGEPSECNRASARRDGGYRKGRPCRVVADAGAVKTDEGPLIESTGEGEAKEVVEYDWEREWYPMYLVAEMPKSAPLGLTVFDKKLVLFYDGNGELNCFEDRCPHRC
jgi:hypothetical protein